MKARDIIGTTLAIAGLFLAVCIMDGSRNETAIRFIGIAMFAAGAFIGRFFDGMTDPELSQQDTDDSGYSKTDDHNPYPQE